MIVHRYPVTQATASMESTHSHVTVQGLGMKALHVRMTLMSVTSRLPVKIMVLVTMVMALTSVDVFRDLKERIVKSTLMSVSQVHANMEVIIFSAFSFFPSGLFSLSLWSTVLLTDRARHTGVCSGGCGLNSPTKSFPSS